MSVAVPKQIKKAVKIQSNGHVGTVLGSETEKMRELYDLLDKPVSLQKAESGYEILYFQSAAAKIFGEHLVKAGILLEQAFVFKYDFRLSQMTTTLYGFQLKPGQLEELLNPSDLDFLHNNTAMLNGFFTRKASDIARLIVSKLTSNKASVISPPSFFSSSPILHNQQEIPLTEYFQRVGITATHQQANTDKFRN